jgi:crotonobetainyl-CoA:carnitine CoA-transferase CaiB-like acyl-CoA transferase
VLTLIEAMDDPQTEVNGMVVTMEHPTEGTVRVLNAPFTLSATPARIRRGAPRLGEHSAEVLAEHGYDDEQLAQLRADAVVEMRPSS